MRKQSLLIFSLLLNLAKCANILTIFNLPTKSHVILGVKLAEGLIKRGHHVTMASPFINGPMENLTEIHLKSILEYRDRMYEKAPPAGFGIIFAMNRYAKDINELFWEDPGIQKIIKEKPKYDAVIMILYFNDATLGIAHHLGVPAIFFSPIGSNTLGNKYVANPNMVYVPNPIVSLMNANNFLGRLLLVTVNGLSEVILNYPMISFYEGILREYLPDAPSLQDLKNNVSLILTNSHFSMEPPRPYVPSMIQIGGFHLDEPKKLPVDIRNYLEGAQHGAILFCMGSNILIANIAEEKRKAIFNVLGDMAPMRVLFKSELDHKNLPENIKVAKWLPQADILAHRNLRVFISHGGLGGNIEAVYHGVPILGVPFFGDQKMNMAEAETAEYAVVVSIDDLTEELLRSKLMEILKNPRYMKKAKKRSALMREQPVKPMDKAAYWIEHVIKYGGGSHLRNAGMNLTWYQLYMFDIYAFYTVFLLLLLVINYYAIKYFIRLMRPLFVTEISKIKSS